LIGEICDEKYRVIRLLGQGGMGSVYEAEAIETGEHVALKRIDADLLVRGKSGVGRFQREARAMGAVDTDHIVRVLDTGTDPASNVPYIAMELLEGEDLEHLLDRVGKLEPDTALRITAQVCLGLIKAHEARVVHRDIKPGNLFLSRGGGGEIVVKILDFGIAKIKPDPVPSGPTTGLTRSGSVLGSPLYMSPEQARGLKDIGFQTDLWSLGVVLYRALSGKVPNKHIDAFGDLIIAICSQAPRPIQDVAPWVGKEVAAVVHRALKLDAEDRFPTAAAMLDAIRPLLSDGWALREELLVPVSAATSAVVASKFPLSPAEDDARWRLVRIAARGHDADGSETTEDLAANARSRAAIAVGTTTGASVMTRKPDGDAASPAKGSNDPSPRARWAAPAAAGLLLAGVLLALGLPRASGPREGLQAQGFSMSVIEAVAPPSATLALPVSATALVAPPPALKQGKLAVFPADASVEVDGKPANVAGGEVTIEGALGSRHHVRIVKGKSEHTEEVIMTDTGASPDRMQLDTAKPRPTAQPGARAPSANARAAGPKPSVSEDSLIPDKFK